MTTLNEAVVHKELMTVNLNTKVTENVSCAVYYYVERILMIASNSKTLERNELESRSEPGGVQLAVSG
jgi:hypothetical protein